MRKAPNGSRTPATCHPERPVKGRGLCSLCYAKSKYSKQPGIFRQRAKNYRERVNREQPGRIARTQRKNHLRRAYGLTPEQFDRLLRHQRCACAVCNKPFLKMPHVDHDHVTNRVRGLLCPRCNPALRALDEVGWYEKARGYLVNPPANILQSQGVSDG